MTKKFVIFSEDINRYYTGRPWDGDSWCGPADKAKQFDSMEEVEEEMKDSLLIEALASCLRIKSLEIKTIYA